VAKKKHHKAARRWRPLAVSLLKIGVSAVLIYLLLHGIGWHELAGQFHHAAWGMLAMSLGAFVISNVLGALQWHLLLRSKGLHIHFARVLGFYHVGLFFNNVLIGNVGGDAFRVFDIRRISGGGATNDALSTVIFDRFLGFFTMASLALFATLVAARQMISASALEAVIFIFIAWLLTSAFLFYEPLAKKFSWIFRLLLPGSLHVKAKAFYYSLHGFRRERKLLAGLLSISVAVQTLRILTHYFAARTLAVSVRSSFFFLFIPIVAMVASLPISLGGLGVREQSAVALFTPLGVTAAKVVAFEFLAYLVGVAASLPGGIIFALRREPEAAREMTL
jgi:glycosyltransferase 2 family protein